MMKPGMPLGDFHHQVSHLHGLRPAVSDVDYPEPAASDKDPETNLEDQERKRKKRMGLGLGSLRTLTSLKLKTNSENLQSDRSVQGES